MSDSGIVVDVVVAGMIVAVAALGLLLVVPAVPLGRAEGPVASAPVAASVAAAGSVLTAPASICADGSTHCDHIPHAPAALGLALAAAAVGLLAGAWWRPAYLRWGLAAGFASTALLAASQYALQAPG